MNNKRSIDFELREIKVKEKVIADVKDIDSGNVGMRMLVIGMKVLVV